MSKDLVRKISFWSFYQFVIFERKRKKSTCMHGRSQIYFTFGHYDEKLLTCKFQLLDQMKFNIIIKPLLN